MIKAEGDIDVVNMLLERFGIKIKEDDEDGHVIEDIKEGDKDD